MVEMLFKTVGNIVFDAEDLDDVETGRKVHEVVGISVEDAIVLSKKTTRQAEEASWYDERSKRITSSNFGRVIKRRKNIEPISIVKMITSSGDKRTSNPYIKSSEFPRNSEENSRKKIRAFRENLGILRTRKMCKNPRKARTIAGPRIPRKLGKLGQISSHEKLGQFSEDS